LKTDPLAAGPLTPPSFTFRDFGLEARVIGEVEPQRVRAYQELRYDHFVRERKWVEGSSLFPGQETDRYDAHCHHLGVFLGERLVSYLRMLPWTPEVGFMLDCEFRELLSEPDRENLLRAGSVEVSRLAVRDDPDALFPPRGRREATDLLFKLLYRVSLAHGYARLYVEVERRWLVAFRRRLPFREFGVPHVFPDGTETVAAYADLAGLEEWLGQRSPEKLLWYRSF
jgi:N-acyl-L-homoserine lactone synthetase